LSFFDEADEPQPTRQETRRPRSAGRPPRARSGRPPGGSGRPPAGSHHQQEVQTRRLVAVGVIVVIVIAMALLIHSCDASATNNSLKNFNASVSELISASTANAQQALGSHGLSSGNLTGITATLDTTVKNARSELTKAKRLSTPGQMSAAERSLVSVMQLREQALHTIATDAQKAASKSTSKDAVYDISLGTSQLYASDVIYKSIVAPDIAKALNAAGIPIGSGIGDQQINGDQIITDLGWLNQTWIEDTIGANLSTVQANANNDQPGLTHGDNINYVTVGGSQLYDGGTYTLTAADARTWVLSVTDGGDTPENEVGCSVSIQNVSDTGTATIPTIAKGATTNCTVTLPSTPPAGPYSVSATVHKVPGETNLKNNTATFTVDFK
jgi:hypothetical protein